MKVFLLVVCLLCCSCIHHFTEPLPVIAEIPGKYIITKFGPRTYFINAWSQTDAEAAAKKELNCAKEVCLMTPGGVILMVEKPAEKSTSSNPKK